MNTRVLIVDDELNLLRSLQRNLRGKFNVTIAEGGVAGITQILECGPFGVIVSDLRMPEIDGVQVLGVARTLAPDSFRVMLSGNVSSHFAFQGPDRKPWFQYVSKPCTTEGLSAVLNEGLDRYQMAISSRRPKSQTVTEDGSPQRLQTLSDAIARCQRLRQLARRLGDLLNLNETWQYELAGLLSQVSRFVSVSDSERPEQTDDHDEAFLRKHAELSCRIISEIPQLEQIADMVRHQYTDRFEPTVPDCVRNGSRILRILTDFEILTETLSEPEAINKIKERSKWYGDPLVQSFSELVSGEPVRRSNETCHIRKAETFHNSHSIID